MAGERKTRRRMTDGDKVLIGSYLAQGWKPKRIAKEMGLSDASIYRVKPEIIEQYQTIGEEVMAKAMRRSLLIVKKADEVTEKKIKKCSAREASYIADLHARRINTFSNKMSPEKKKTLEYEVERDHTDRLKKARERLKITEKS